jgi:hypothetical protein
LDFCKTKLRRSIRSFVPARGGGFEFLRLPIERLGKFQQLDPTRIVQ